MSRLVKNLRHKENQERNRKKKAFQHLMRQYWHNYHNMNRKNNKKTAKPFYLRAIKFMSHWQRKQPKSRRRIIIAEKYKSRIGYFYLVRGLKYHGFKNQRNLN